MLADCFRRFALFALPCLVMSPAAGLAADARRPVEVVPARAVDYWNPEQVKPLLEEFLNAPEQKPAVKLVLYSGGVGHFDDFLPSAPDLTKEPPAAAHHRFTFHNGRVALTECFDAAGAKTGYQVVRSTRSGAPRATGFYNGEGKALWYKFADYDPVGRISRLYTFSDAFELRHFEEFTYRGEALDIRRRDRDRNLQFDTIYEEGGIFLVMNDVKRRVNTGTRRDVIRGPVKQGLKSMYPGYDEP